jgi:superfamily II DNA or RNA helicase
MTISNLPNAILNLKSSYKTRDGGLGSDFFEPCLNYCEKYHRAAGYFSSSVLRSWSSSLLNIVNEKVSIKLLISPELSEIDTNLFYSTSTDNQKKEVLVKASDKIIEDIIKFIDSPDDVELRLQILAWLIASNQLEIRFALPKHIDGAGIFHEKSGVFYFPFGETVAFEGSANETAFGHSRNYEKVQVFRSWKESELERIVDIEEDFEFYWEGKDDTLEVVKLSEHSLHLIKARAPNQRPLKKKPVFSQLNRWRHQDEALNAFLKNKHGILEMATGTGKTRTSLLILEELFNRGLVNGAIISTSGNDLLDQWYGTILTSKMRTNNKLRLIRNYEQYHDGQAFAQNPIGSILVVSRDELFKVINGLDKSLSANLIIIHDEVHGLGAPLCQKNLVGKHQQFGYKLGLSATPDREYDDIGSTFITNEIGPVIYKFGLKEAIERGILVEFDYTPLEYELTDDDRGRLSSVYKLKAIRAKEGSPMSNEELWTKLSAVYKTAELKPKIFADYLKSNPFIIKNSIIFVDNREYGEKILSILSEYTHLYRTYYAEDDKQNLIDFAKGNIDCLITCHKISQGIDIQHLKSVILFSAARARLETIQRIGRCLRLDPNSVEKRALVIDFVRANKDNGEEQINADVERRDWLLELSRIKRQE